MCVSNSSLVYNFAVVSFFAHTISLFFLNWLIVRHSQQCEVNIYWTKDTQTATSTELNRMETLCTNAVALCGRIAFLLFAILFRKHQLNEEKLIEIKIKTKQKSNKINENVSLANLIFFDKKRNSSLSFWRLDGAVLFNRVYHIHCVNCSGFG